MIIRQKNVARSCKKNVFKKSKAFPMVAKFWYIIIPPHTHTHTHKKSPYFLPRNFNRVPGSYSSQHKHLDVGMLPPWVSISAGPNRTFCGAWWGPRAGATLRENAGAARAVPLYNKSRMFADTSTPVSHCLCDSSTNKCIAYIMLCLLVQQYC